MPDVFSKKQRSEVTPRIRSRGNRDTEFARVLAAGAQLFEIAIMELTLPVQIEGSLTPDEARMGLALGLYRRRWSGGDDRRLGHEAVSNLLTVGRAELLPHVAGEEN